MTENRFGLITPTFGVDDLAAAISYYVERLGFILDFEWGEPPSFAGLYRDDVQLFLSARGDAPAGSWATIEVDDVDALHRAYATRGVAIIRPPGDEAYGVRSMSVRDPAGNVLFFSTELPHDDSSGD